MLIELESGRLQNVEHDTDSNDQLDEEHERCRLGRALVGEHVRHGLERGAHVAEDDLGGYETDDRGDHVLLEINVRHSEQRVGKAERYRHESAEQDDAEA